MKTTKKQFEYFQKIFRHWQTVFSLNDWESSFYHENIGETDEELGAGVVCDMEARMVDVYLYIDSPIPINNALIEKFANHEVLELLLYELRSLCFEPGVSKERVTSVVHGVIHSIQYALDKAK